jgi:hypothetical protein
LESQILGFSEDLLFGLHQQEHHQLIIWSSAVVEEVAFKSAVAVVQVVFVWVLDIQ